MGGRVDVNYSGNQMLNTASALQTSMSVKLFQQKNLFTIAQAAMHFIKALHVEFAMLLLI